jgi:hypothetical protein
MPPARLPPSIVPMLSIVPDAGWASRRAWNTGARNIQPRNATTRGSITIATRVSRVVVIP